MIRRLAVLVTTIVVASTLGMPAASATSHKQEEVVHLTKIVKGTNKPCDKGFDKQVRVSLRVPRGHSITSHGPLALQLQDGRHRFSGGSAVGDRLVEYYFDFSKRKWQSAKIDRELVASYAYAELTEGSSYTLVALKQCHPRVP